MKITKNKLRQIIAEEFSFSGMKDAAKEKAKEAAYEFAKEQAKEQAKEKADDLKKKALGVFGLGDDEEGEGEGPVSSSGGSSSETAGASKEKEGLASLASWGFFDKDGNLKKGIKFEGISIDDMIQDEVNKILREKNIREGGYKKTYKRDNEDETQHIKGASSETNSGKFDYIEGSVLEEAELGAPNTNCTPGQPGGTCADAYNVGAISEDEDDLGLDIEDREDPIDPMDPRYDDDPIDVSDLENPKHDISDPVDPRDSKYDDREHAYWVQDPKMWSAFEAFYEWQKLHPEGGLAVMPGTYKVLQGAKAALEAALNNPEDPGIEVVGPMARKTRDRNFEFQDAIEDHDPAATPAFKAWTKTPDFKAWLKNSKGNKMNESKKLTRSMLKAILQEEYRNVLEEYGMKPQYSRDDGAELVVADDYSGALSDISNAVQEMIKDKYQIDDDDIFEVALEQPPGDDNYMIRIQWNVDPIEGVSEDMPALADLEAWLKDQSFEDIEKWQDIALAMDGSERVKMGDIFGDIGELSDIEVDSGLIAVALKNARQ